METGHRRARGGRLREFGLSDWLVSLWIGDDPGAVERACLQSAVRHGHKVALYCYRAPAVPIPGVEVRDAATILPEDSIIRYRSGSVSLFSNWFRYALMRRGAGVWIDADTYFVAPLDTRQDWIFGLQDERIVNMAVFKVPADSPVLDELLAPFERGARPAGLSPRQRLALLGRRLRGERLTLADMPWGSTGPNALTKVLRRHGLVHLAQPVDVFSPIPYLAADSILRPDMALDDVVSARTVAVHLWNELIKPFKTTPAPEGSILARLQREGAA